MNKKFSAVIAAAVAVILGVCFAVSSFGFVKDNYGVDQIKALSDVGLIESRGASASVTRGEALKAVMIAASVDGGVADFKPEDAPCPFTDMSDGMKPYISIAYNMGIVSDMPYDEFCENENITLTDMLVFTLRAAGYAVDEADAFGVAENAMIYKTCESDALVFELPYACYAEILWNLLSARGVSAEKTFAELLIEKDFMSAGDYESAQAEVSDYVFGQEHDYATNAVVRTDPVSSEDSDTETTKPAETTAPPVTSYETEDNSGYSPPFKP